MLKQLNIPHFFDSKMEIGQDSVAQMAAACLACRVGLVILSDNFINSRWCLKELNTFLLRHRQSSLERSACSSSGSSASGGAFDFFPAFFHSRLLREEPEYEEVSRFTACLRRDQDGALEFVVSKLLPMLVDFAPIQSLPCIVECHKRMAADPLLLHRLCNEYQQQYVPRAHQRLFPVTV
jgi:hypothetical protein